MPPPTLKPNSSQLPAGKRGPLSSVSFKSKPISKDLHKSDKKALDQLRSQHINIKRMYSKLQHAEPPSIVRHNPKRKEVSKLMLPKPCTGEAIPLHERLGRPQTEEERERDLQLEREQI